ncbi:alkylated DNA repair [Caulobacter phage CcrColossus]|uniref:Putative oxoglutarate oxygenase domain protein n=1 Tax=Caulobacter phage CcrColossus TaxID=1211640 RepID=K4JRX9_9CAUD|nr:alkylated DNA repair [Caulobacter phage CcrColossus]AFU88099.1 putative oxoglutarate oxygenase domain protein [Caulobacter phage CcrColossus]
MTAPVTYIADFIPPGIVSALFDSLRSELAWQRRVMRNVRIVDGVEHVTEQPVPRAEYWTNTFNRPYTYGRGAGIRTYQPQPDHEIIGNLRSALEAQHNSYLEGCFLNMYENGRDALGWHADDDPGIDHSKPIAVITLGQGRELRYKAQEPGSHPISIFLEPGSLLLMHAGMQQTHYHMIPAVKDREIGTRISLTYRGLIQ